MCIKTVVIAAVIAATPALAFTNGSLVPAYLCNPNPDGLPKSFGQVLPFTREQTPTVAFSQNANQNVKAPALGKQGNLQIGNSAYILASLHDSPNSINSINQGIKVKTANGGPIVAGQANKLVLSSGAANVALKGAVLVGQDAKGVRQGSFTDQGNTFINFPGCGKNPQGQISGVIQQTGVSATGTYNQLVYNAPACVTGGNLTLAGLSVTGKGFGTWSQSFQVTGSKCTTGNNGANANNANNANNGTSQTGGQGQTGRKGQAGANGQTGAKGAAGTNGQTGANGQNVGKGQTGGTDQAGGKAQAGGKGQTGGQAQSGAKAQTGAKGQAGSGGQDPCDDQTATNGQTGGKNQAGGKYQATGQDQTGGKAQAGAKGQAGAGNQDPCDDQTPTSGQASQPAAPKPSGRYQKRPAQDGKQPC